MSEESFKIYSGKRCEGYYKKYNLVSAVHKIIDLEDIIKEVREYIESYGITKEQLKKMSFGSAAPISIGEMLNILQILDKVEENK